MNAKDTIKAVKSCQTIEQLNEFANDERKSVQNAILEKRNELLATPEPNSHKSDSNSGNTHKPSGNEQKRIMEFRSKIPFTCRAENLISFAKAFFGKDLESAEKTAPDHVMIKLKSGTEVPCRVV